MESWLRLVSPENLQQKFSLAHVSVRYAFRSVSPLETFIDVVLTAGTVQSVTGQISDVLRLPACISICVAAATSVTHGFQPDWFSARC